MPITNRYKRNRNRNPPPQDPTYPPKPPRPNAASASMKLLVDRQPHPGPPPLTSRGRQPGAGVWSTTINRRTTPRITLLNRKTNDILIEAAHGLSPQQAPRPLQAGRGRHRQGGADRRARDHPQERIPAAPQPHPARQGRADTSFLCVPIKSGKEVVGALSVDRTYDPDATCRRTPACSDHRLHDRAGGQAAPRRPGEAATGWPRRTSACAQELRSASAPPTSSATRTRCRACTTRSRRCPRATPAC
jgi:hypothetical protein